MQLQEKKHFFDDTVSYNLERKCKKIYGLFCENYFLQMPILLQEILHALLTIFGKIDYTYHPHLQIIPQNPWTPVTTMPHSKLGFSSLKTLVLWPPKKFIVDWRCCMLKNLGTEFIFQPPKKIFCHNCLHILSQFHVIFIISALIKWIYK